MNPEQMQRLIASLRPPEPDRGRGVVWAILFIGGAGMIGFAVYVFLRFSPFGQTIPDRLNTGAHYQVSSGPATGGPGIPPMFDPKDLPPANSPTFEPPKTATVEELRAQREKDEQAFYDSPVYRRLKGKQSWGLRTLFEHELYGEPKAVADHFWGVLLEDEVIDSATKTAEHKIEGGLLAYYYVVYKDRWLGAVTPTSPRTLYELTFLDQPEGPDKSYLYGIREIDPSDPSYTALRGN